jgi:glycosyltransferase involved in cell wall biosynthesis
MMPQIALPAADIERLAQLPIRRAPTPFRVISLGRMISWKGLHLGLRAFARFTGEHPDSEYWHSGDGPERERFLRLAQELGVADKVQVFTKQKRAEALEALAQSDVLLFPCLHDEPGWVVLEALAAGRPVVYLLGMPRTPDADQSGFTPRTDTADHAVEDMAAALLRLATDPDLRAQMGEAGRAQVAAHFNWDTRGQEFLALYDEISQVAAQRVSPS